MAFNINTGIISAFGLRAKKVTREKSYYVCETDDGLFKVARAAGTPEHILFQHMVKERAAEAGYPWADRFRLSVTGQPFAAVANEIWTASSYVKGREVGFENWNDIARIISAVRRWHSCVRGLPVLTEYSGFTSPPLTGTFRKQATELNAMAKRVRRQTRLSDFDVLFIKNVAFYGEQIKNALLLLEQSDYTERHQNARQNGHICHHVLKEESLTFFDEDVYITHYEEASFDTQLTDIAALIRRYVQRAGNSAVPVSQILEAVSNTEPLTGKEIEVLYALLLFPWNFMKTAGQYYSKKRTWTPNAIINRMQAVINEAVYFNEYIRALRIT